MNENNDDGRALGSIANALSISISNIVSKLVEKRVLSPEEAISAFQSAADVTDAMGFGRSGPYLAERMALVLRERFLIDDQS